MFARFGLALFCISILLMDLANATDNAGRINSQMSVRLVDEDLDGAVQRGPPDEDRIPFNLRGGVTPGWLWLKRAGAISGDIISDVHAATVAGQPVVQFTFTPDAGGKFIALTRGTRGHRLAIVLNDTIISTPLIAGEPDGLGIQIDGDYTDAEARDLAAEMRRTIRPAVQNPFLK